jgi:hypothetical protein
LVRTTELLDSQGTARRKPSGLEDPTTGIFNEPAVVTDASYQIDTTTVQYLESDPDRTLGIPVDYDVLNGWLNPSIATALIHNVIPRSLPEKDRDMYAFQKLWSLFDSTTNGTHPWTITNGMNPNYATLCLLDKNSFWEQLLDDDTCNDKWYKKFYNCNNNDQMRGVKKQCSKDYIEFGMETGLVMLGLDITMGWNMCRNLEWIVCALRARLPDRRGVENIRFATSPKLRLKRFLSRDPGCRHVVCEIENHLFRYFRRRDYSDLVSLQK